MVKEEKFRRDLLCTLSCQAKPKYALLLKRNEIVLLAHRYHLLTTMKTTTKSTNDTKKETKTGNKIQSKEEQNSTLSKSTSILVHPTFYNIITLRFTYLIPSNTVIALKLTKLLILLPELVPDHRSHHTLTLRHDLHFIAIDPVVLAANDQLLPLLAV